MKLLLSGFIGAFIATLLSIFYSYITEQVRHRREIMIKVVEWADDIYDKLEFLHVQKEKAYTEGKRALSDEEYWKMSKELKRTLLSSKISAMVALVYGEQEEVRKINALQGELLKILSSLYTSNKTKWEELNEDINEKFKKVIDPLRISISRRFLIGTRVSSILGDLFKSNILNIWRLIMKIKKIIAREGLVIMGIIVIGCFILLISSVYPPIPKPKIIYIEQKENIDQDLSKDALFLSEDELMSVQGLAQSEQDAIAKMVEFRKKYPEYDDLDNISLAEKLTKKYPEYQNVYKNIKSIYEKMKDKTDEFNFATAKPSVLLSKKSDIYEKRGKISSIGFYFLLFTYPLYLIIRFIIWATKTLKGNTI